MDCIGLISTAIVLHDIRHSSLARHASQRGCSTSFDINESAINQLLQHLSNSGIVSSKMKEILARSML